MNDDTKDPIIEALSEDKLKNPSPEMIDEEDFDGGMTNPEGVEDEDTLDRAHRVGLYEDSDEEHPAPVGGAAYIDEREKKVA